MEDLNTKHFSLGKLIKKDNFYTSNIKYGDEILLYCYVNEYKIINNHKLVINIDLTNTINDNNFNNMIDSNRNDLESYKQIFNEKLLAAVNKKSKKWFKKELPLNNLETLFDKNNIIITDKFIRCIFNIDNETVKYIKINDIKNKYLEIELTPINIFFYVDKFFYELHIKTLNIIDMAELSNISNENCVI